MMTTKRKQVIRNIIIYTVLVNLLAWLGPVLGGDPANPGLGFLVWGTAPVVATLVMKFVFRDKGGVYSGIAREYLPDDPRIDGYTNIVDEMKDGFEKLYPLYDMMAYRMSIPKPQKTAPDLSGLFGGAARVKGAKV